MTRDFRPGTDDKFFARFRKAIMTLRAPKSASAVDRDGMPKDGVPRDATSTVPCGLEMLGVALSVVWLEATAEVFIPLTTRFRRAASAVKFWVTLRTPPNSTIAIKRLGPALASINLAAASRALACSSNSMLEL